jgi:hypothetical protein
MEQTAKQAAEWFAKFGTKRKRSEVIPLIMQCEGMLP